MAVLGAAVAAAAGAALAVPKQDIHREPRRRLDDVTVDSSPLAPGVAVPARRALDFGDRRHWQRR